MDRSNPIRKAWLYIIWRISHPETSPITWMGIASIEAIGIFRTRHFDRVGISYFTRVSNDDL
jgi:hypothetical protein